MRPARLARAWCARQLDDQRTRRPCRKLLQKTFDRRNVSEGMEAIAVDAKLARGLWSAQHQYGVTFLIAAKAVVKGPDVHPFFSWGRKPRQTLFRGWNFHKYLIGRDGYIAEAFASTVEPTDARIKPRLAGRFRKAEAARKRQVSPQLTGPAGKSPRRIKAVAVAAQLLLG